MNHKLLSISVIVALVLSVFAVVQGYVKKPKIAYIKSQDLFVGYEGMKEAKARYEEKVNGLQANFDTLSSDYQKSLKRFDQEYSRLGSKERAEKTQLLRSQVQNLEQYKQTVEEKIQKEDEALSQGVYNQINDYIKQYGEANGYLIILGTTNNGNILYGQDAIDITKDVLEGLNKSYKGKK